MAYGGGRRNTLCELCGGEFSGKRRLLITDPGPAGAESDSSRQFPIDNQVMLQQFI